MKLVQYFPKNETISKNISEAQSFEIVKKLKILEAKSQYEFARGLDEKNVLHVIYKENRITRTRNTWYEMRALTSLSKFLDKEFYYSYKTTWKGYETEVDGVSLDEKLAVEIKRQTIDKKTLRFLEHKLYDLGFDKLIVIAPKFKSLEPSADTTLLVFRPSFTAAMKYYQTSFTIWKAFWNLAQQRHFRYLLANGRWRPQRRRYTKSSKWSPSQRMIHEIGRFYRQYSFPIKIYFSLSRLIGPLHEFEGKGYPIDLFIAAFDVDGKHQGNHILGKQGYCNDCMIDAKKRLTRFTAYLDSNEFEYVVLNSGSKGFHVYLMQNNKIMEITRTQMEKITMDNEDVIDSFLSKRDKEFDNHRIFKVPYSIDASTGTIIGNEKQYIDLRDNLIKKGEVIN
ncbi:MAG: hypothetical protein ACXAD7_07705 [Candidatus Kariarchaeaceae archaeon]|jgi:hypothetical protein